MTTSSILRLQPETTLPILLCAVAFSACSGPSNSGAVAGMGGAGGTTYDATGGTKATGGSSPGGATNLALGGTQTVGGSQSMAMGGAKAGAGGVATEPTASTSRTAGAGSGGSSPNGGARTTTAGSNANGGRAAGGSASGGQATGGKAAGGSASGGQTAGGQPTGGQTAGSMSVGGKPQRITAASGASLVTLKASVKHQKFEGWGTSMCWWANRIGGWRNDKVDQFVKLLVNPTTGLGYNIFRYNIGGGENPAHSHMTEYRDMPGFQPTKGTWDWSADARQVAVLRQIVAIGQNVIMEAFSNSPPYWMTKSGCASGSSDGSNNLKDDSYEPFADYLTEVVKHYRDDLGITFRTLEPMNEPNANWWKSDGSQEGCHFGASSQQQLIKAVGAQLATKGLTGTHVSASDENSMDDAYTIMSGYDTTTLGYVAQMNAHSYAGTRRTELRTLATSKGKRLWQSESGPLSVTLASNTDAAMFMAGRIITDLRDLKPEAWIDWQAYDTASNWTSFSINASQQSATPVKRFYMHAAFSRFIRPGATFVEIDNANMVAALASDGISLTVVVRNGETANTKSFTFDLTDLPSIGSSVEVYRTSATEDLAHLPPIALENWSFTASSAPFSVTTYVIPLTR